AAHRARPLEVRGEEGLGAGAHGDVALRPLVFLATVRRVTILATWCETFSRHGANAEISTTASPLRAVPSIVAHSRSLDIPSESRGARMRSPPRGRFLKRTFDKIKRTFKMNEWTGGNRHAARARRRATTRLPAADRRVASVEASRAAARRATR